MSHVTILVAEDFVSFREFVQRQLQARPEFRVVTVNDGMAAVAEAKALQPDFVVLDLNLPKLNGFAAAQHIRKLSPASRIVLLTQESSPDVVHESLERGFAGYIHKTCAGYLLPTLEAILESRHVVEDNDKEVRQVRPPRHQVHFHTDDATLIEAGARFLAAALQADDAAIAIATQEHLQQLLRRLRTLTNHVDRAIEQGSFAQFDANELAVDVLSGGVARWRPTFEEMLASLSTAATGADPEVAMFGEGGALLSAAGHIDAASELEQLGDDILRMRPARILCAYPMLPTPHDRRFKTICGHHDAIAVRCASGHSAE